MEPWTIDVHSNFTKYDWSKSYQWNYDHAPDPRETLLTHVDPVSGDWKFCSLKAASPLGISAGPLLNGRWLIHYAQLGFDVLTYKTVRSRYRESYPSPNLQPIHEDQVESGQVVHATDRMAGSWAISFGMPSMAPEFWRRDVEWTRRQLSRDKLLSVSVVSSPDSDWSLQQVADDYAKCAQWAAESGADCVELNFSCPNVASVDGQLYQDPPSARLVLQTVRDRIGTVPLAIKIGWVDGNAAADALLDACSELIQGISMTNCLACTIVQPDDSPMFDGQPRGIGGEAIRQSSVDQVRLFSRLSQQRSMPISIIGVGGIFGAAHVHEYLDAGAESTQIATAAMLQPDLALSIRQAFHQRVG